MFRKRRGVLPTVSLLLIAAFGIGITCHRAHQEDLNHALLDAVLLNDPTAVRNLVREGADSNIRRELPNAPHSPGEVFQWVMRSHERLLYRNPAVLSEAAEYGDLQVVEALLDGGALIDSTDIDGNTALIYAVIGGRIDIVRVLLERGARITARDRYGKTAMKMAEENSRTDIVQILKGAGARVE
jgi:ankyrin repeat protein